MEKDNKDAQRKIFMEGLEKFRKKGIPVLIDGNEFGSGDYETLFEVKEDGSFYMGDYISTDAGKLAEIRFDKVYYK